MEQKGKYFYRQLKVVEIIAGMDERLQSETIVIDDNWRLQQAMTPNALSPTFDQ